MKIFLVSQQVGKEMRQQIIVIALTSKEKELVWLV